MHECHLLLLSNCLLPQPPQVNYLPVQALKLHHNSVPLNSVFSEHHLFFLGVLLFEGLRPLFLLSYYHKKRNPYYRNRINKNLFVFSFYLTF